MQRKGNRVMKKIKWFLLGILTIGVGFLIYKFYNKDSQKNTYIDGFSEGYLNGFSATLPPDIPKQYGQIAREIKQKQVQAYKHINAKHVKQRNRLKA